MAGGAKPHPPKRSSSAFDRGGQTGPPRSNAFFFGAADDAPLTTVGNDRPPAVRRTVVRPPNDPRTTPEQPRKPISQTLIIVPSGSYGYQPRQSSKKEKTPRVGEPQVFQIISSYGHIIILSYDHTIMLSYDHALILSYDHVTQYHTIILSYYHHIIR